MDQKEFPYNKDYKTGYLINGSENRKIINDDYFVFYNNLKSPDGAVEHTGDNRTGEGDGDDESIRIDLTSINPQVTEIVVVVTIFEADKLKQNFGQVRNSFIRIYNTDTQEEILRYELEEDFSVETAVEFGRIYKKNGQWKFEAIGVGQKGGLREYLNIYN